MKTIAPLPAAIILAAITATIASGQENRRTAAPDPRDNSPADSRRGGARPTEIGVSPADIGAPGIAWYGSLEVGLAEAKRSNRPIFFMSAASQCGGVPGVF